MTPDPANGRVTKGITINAYQVFYVEFEIAWANDVDKLLS